MGIREIFEYQDTAELGIEASTPSRWVPVEFVAVKTFVAIKEGVETLTKAAELAGKVLGRISGSMIVGNSNHGNVYDSHASAD